MYYYTKYTSYKSGSDDLTAKQLQGQVILIQSFLLHMYKLILFHLTPSTYLLKSLSCIAFPSSQLATVRIVSALSPVCHCNSCFFQSQLCRVNTGCFLLLSSHVGMPHCKMVFSPNCKQYSQPNSKFENIHVFGVMHSQKEMLPSKRDYPACMTVLSAVST